LEQTDGGNLVQEIVLGAVEQFSTFPAEVKIKQHDYFLLKDGETYRLVSNICPHAGYFVELEGHELVCSLHGWEFDTATGACLNVRATKLKPYPVVERDGELIAQLA
jgi:nitrite reductase/ring-hydroxylating ferredoxin subunit